MSCAVGSSGMASWRTLLSRLLHQHHRCMAAWKLLLSRRLARAMEMSAAVWPTYFQRVRYIQHCLDMMPAENEFVWHLDPDM